MNVYHKFDDDDDGRTASDFFSLTFLPTDKFFSLQGERAEQILGYGPPRILQRMFLCFQ